MGSTNDVDGCNDRIKTHNGKTRVFMYSEAVLAFIEAKAKMKLPDMIKGCVTKTEFSRHENRCGAVKNEIGGNEG